MTRRKRSEETEKKWEGNPSSSPYRASVGPDMEWDLDRPSWTIANAYKASVVDDRLILAFEIEEVRDYFIEGHRNQDIHVEPDWAEEATPHKEIKKQKSQTKIEEIQKRLIEAKIAAQAGNKEVEKIFNNEINKLLDQKKLKKPWVSSTRCIRTVS